MKAYVDSSVVLRVAFGHEGRLASWVRMTDPITSDLARIECLRVLDRQRLSGALDDDELAERREAVEDLLARRREPDLRFATHDAEMSIAARALGFRMLA